MLARAVIKLRTLTISLALIIILVSQVRADEPFRNITFNDACAAAKDEGKVVMIDFYTPWCFACKKLDRETWSDEKVRAWLLEKTVALKIDAKREKDLADRLKIHAYPTIVFLKNDCVKFDHMVGYKPPAEFLSKAEKILAGKALRKPMVGIPADTSQKKSD